MDLGREHGEPLIKRLLGIHDNFKFAVFQAPDHTRAFGRERNFHPLTIEAERVSYFKNSADLSERHGLKTHDLVHPNCGSILCVVESGVNVGRSVSERAGEDGAGFVNLFRGDV